MRKVLFIKLFFAVTVLTIIVAVLCCIIGTKAVRTRLVSVENEAMATLNDTFRLHFLNNLSAELSQSDCIIDQVNKNHLLKRIAQQKEKYKNSNLPMLGDLIVDQINFLISVKDELSTNECPDIENLISQEIISLRIMLLTQLDDISDATFNYCRAKTFSLFYLPTTLGAFLQGGPFDDMPELPQMADILETIWPNECRAITYTVDEAFPAEKYILDTSNFYADVNFVPLDYDLCLPRRLAGLKEGWHKSRMGKYWTQFWKNDNDDVINVNIFYANQNHANVTIVFVNKMQAIPLFDFYYNFHKPTGQDVDVAKKRMLNGDAVFQPLNISE